MSEQRKRSEKRKSSTRKPSISMTDFLSAVGSELSVGKRSIIELCKKFDRSQTDIDRRLCRYLIAHPNIYKGFASRKNKMDSQPILTDESSVNDPIVNWVGWTDDRTTRGASITIDMIFEN